MNIKKVTEWSQSFLRNLKRTGFPLRDLHNFKLHLLSLKYVSTAKPVACV